MNILKKNLNQKFIRKWTEKGLNPIVLSIMDRRGLNNDEDIINVFSPVFENIPSPFVYKEMIKAFLRLDDAIKNNEKILIFGDIDVDGATSTVLLVKFLRDMNAMVHWELPSALDHYGLNIDKIKVWKDKGYKLCITVDCGISNIDEIKWLYENQIDTIIIDHHETLNIIPEAYAIINPKNENFIQFKNIAGCGVVFLFITGYLLYKSKYYDKKIGLIYVSSGRIVLISFVNFMEINRQEIYDFNEIDRGEFSYLFFYTDSYLLQREIKIFIAESKVELLKPINKIYENKFFNILEDTLLRSKFSLFNKIFSEIKEIEKIKKQFLPLVMLATIADIMPLIKDNRILSRLGLNYLKNENNSNIAKICNALGINQKEITSKDISWFICPLLNAPGRMGESEKTVELLLNEFDDDLVSEIIEINEKRKKTGDKAFNLFLNEIDSNKKEFCNNLVFFYSDSIYKGITGITATKLSKHSNCPTIVAAKEGEYYTGSIRGESNFHFVSFLEKFSSILIQYGGHKKAAGFRFHEKDLETFINFLQENSNLLSNNSQDNSIEIDAEIPVRYLNYDLLKILSVFEPFGEKNGNPILLTQGLEVSNYYVIGKDRRHLKLYFQTENKPFVGLFWNKAEWFEKIHSYSQKYNLLYQLEIDKYNEQVIIQMNILDMEICKR